MGVGAYKRFIKSSVITPFLYVAKNLWIRFFKQPPPFLKVEAGAVNE